MMDKKKKLLRLKKIKSIIIGIIILLCGAYICFFRDYFNENDLNVIKCKNEASTSYNAIEKEKLPDLDTSSKKNEKSNEISESKSNNDYKVNINKASADELIELPGVGEKTAQRIIEYREKNGGFSNKEEIKSVKRIGEKTYEKLKSLIYVD